MTATKILGSVLLLGFLVIALVFFVPAEYLVGKNRGVIEHAGDATKLKLRRYEITGFPYEIRSWLEGPHDGAVGQQIAYVLLNWSLSHPDDFVYIVEGLSSNKNHQIAEWLGGMTEDAMVQTRFLETFDRFDSPVISQMKFSVKEHH
jgi:hypothetical protein